MAMNYYNITLKGIIIDQTSNILIYQNAKSRTAWSCSIQQRIQTAAEDATAV